MVGYQRRTRCCRIIPGIKVRRNIFYWRLFNHLLFQPHHSQPEEMAESAEIGHFSLEAASVYDKALWLRMGSQMVRRF
jgi:hypothetical protein